MISGATGCIGFSLVQKLMQNGHDIYVLLNPQSSRNSVIEQFIGVKKKYVSLGDYAQLNIDETVDAFIHMAWRGGTSRNDFETNQWSSFQSVEAIKLASRLGCKKFISLGSQAEYGLTNEIINEELLCTPNTEFGIAKLNTYFRLKNFSERNAMQYAWLRVLSAYGRYDRDSSMLSTVIMSHLSNKEMGLSDCSQNWDFLHADDVAEAILKLSIMNIQSSLYVIGSDEHRTLKEYIEELCAALGASPTKLIGKINLEKDTVVNLRCDSSRLREHTGWVPVMNFQKGIGDLVSWHRSRAHHACYSYSPL